MPNILYLVHNLSDPAVARRVEMFRHGGATVEIAGFRRADAPLPDLPPGTVVELARTHDARLTHRMLATLRAGYTAKEWARQFSRPDVIVARNLEMLAIAHRLRAIWAGAPRLVYECLDIHRMMLREDGVGRGMRGLERHLLQSTDLLITSSPAFAENYFRRQNAPPICLVENKVFAPRDVAVGSNPALAGRCEPIRIGWFGALRCNRSLAALAGLAKEAEGGIEVVLRGRPALTEFDDFHATTDAAQNLSYLGTYNYPDDLPSIYSGVHFAWAVDFFEAGQNSSWLLPNRIYEGCLNGAIPIAVSGTETAAFIERLGIGIVVPDIDVGTLRAVFDGMTPSRIEALASQIAAQDIRHFRADQAECTTLVERISGHDSAVALQGLAA
ncbi:succinoglycan biosynthesis protein ExoL [Devosia lucknowensis]|uniref:Succinoglycan biosynthesis protein ExoL n=1 Tax=Devosia lucknowensis TaxID=1096929 RepID=A0A1Y6FP58_9HYPH|nr:glycosyltransferase [Devosia lucknowensis]SMQ76026.1 succinoglycan biosynthesis protein ExoL [Devosia lucknowensis]